MVSIMFSLELHSKKSLLFGIVLYWKQMFSCYIAEELDDRNLNIVLLKVINFGYDIIIKSAGIKYYVNLTFLCRSHLCPSF